jgi:formylglycine-generating enzyme required for sulfatase activity
LKSRFFSVEKGYICSSFCIYAITKQIKNSKTIKTMKKGIILGISLLLAGAVGVLPGRVQAARMAVLVVGLATDAASDEFAAGIRYEYTQKGYTMVTDATVSAKLTELRNLHKQNQPVDTVGLAAWGKDNSIDFVQLVVESDCTITIEGVARSGREQLAQVVRCGAEPYSSRGYYRTRFIPDLKINLGTEFDEMVYVAGGVFEMGWKDGRDGTPYNNNEKPSHHVRVNSFYMGKYEVTQALWKAVMGSNPSTYVGDNKPVETVTWEDITKIDGFLATLNAMTGKNYRLPTEAEWEYAARGCNGGVCESAEYSGSNIAGDVSYDNTPGGPLAVGTKRSNALGFYDMSGNVFEWCRDLYSGSYYSSAYTEENPQDNPTGADSGSTCVFRGGSWYSPTARCRVAARGAANVSYCLGDVGFRLV